LPDVTLLTPAQYKAAEKVLTDSKQLINLYGVGVLEGRGERDKNAVLIGRVTHREGGVGAGGGSTYLVEKVDNGVITWDEYLYPEKTTNIIYRIYIIANTTDNDRFLVTMLADIFGKRVWLTSLNDDASDLTGERVYLDFSYDFSRSGPQGHDRIYDYIMKDVWMETPVLVREDIPQLLNVIGRISDGNDEEGEYTEIITN